MVVSAILLARARRAATHPIPARHVRAAELTVQQGWTRLVGVTARN